VGGDKKAILHPFRVNFNSCFPPTLKLANKYFLFFFIQQVDVKSPRPKRPGLHSIDRLKPRTESPKETTVHPHQKMAGLSGTVVKQRWSGNRREFDSIKG
jgi:hypothetical protein